MMWRIYLMELRLRFTRPQTYIYWAIITFGAFIAIMGQAGAFGAAGFGRRVLNGPYHVAEGALTFSMFGVLITAGYMGQAVFRDFRTGIFPLVFTTPVSKGAYLGGRFLGALTGNAFILTGWAVGLVLALNMPNIDPARIGAFELGTFVQPYVVFILPTLLFTAAIFFALPALTRKILPNYVAGIALLVGYLLATAISQDLDKGMMAALADPFGGEAFYQLTQYWSITEQNTLTVPLSGYLLLNRLLWMGVAAVVFGLMFVRFRFEHGGEALSWWAKRRSRKSDQASVGTQKRPGPLAAIHTLSLPAATPSYSASARWRQYLSETWTHFVATVRNIYFIAIVCAGLVFLIGSALFLDLNFGTTVYPVTQRVVSVLGGSFSLFFLIIITYYAGEMVWRERDLGLQQITDSLPTPNWLSLASKVSALILVHLVLLTVIMIYGIVVQTLRGYFRYEIGVYVRELFGVQFADLVLLTVFAFFIQVLVNHKYVGYVLLVGYLLIVDFSGELGLEHNLYIFSGDSGIPYSDMNRYGHFLLPFTWFKLYWASICLGLAALSSLLWVRGQDTKWKVRRALARQRLTAKAILSLGVAATLFLSLGGFIFYNTNILHEYVTSNESDERAAAYERAYKQYEHLDPPGTVDIDIEVDVHPSERAIYAHGEFLLVNNTGRPIDSLPVDYRQDVVELRTLEFDPPAELVLDGEQGFRIYEFARAIAPGDSILWTVDLAYETKGFENQTGGTELVHNGTFINGAQLFPTLGYSTAAELSDENARRRLGLPPRARALPADDPEGLMRSSVVGGWATFDAVLSTAPDQTAIAPGTLLREWEEGGRRYFHYSTGDQRMTPFYSIISASYEVARDEWNGVDLEVYYHPKHDFNVNRFMNGLRKSLAYFSEQFAPYPFEQARIIEFPRYASFAQAFPGTMPYSEGIGFIADVDDDDPTSIDYPFFVTAHEVAHQWWGHLARGGDVQGNTMLTESLAEYSALKVLEHEHGPEEMRRFLEDELDGYLAGRANETRKEEPLMFVEGQGYIRYQKGSLAFYALSDYIGEEALNAALRAYVEDWAYRGPPYPSTYQFMDYIRAATPDSLHYFLEDTFENITLYDLRTTSAEYVEVESGVFDVTLNVSAQKLRSDSVGVETPISMNDWIDVGVFADDDMRKPLYLEKHHLADGESTVTVRVRAAESDNVPIRAGVDPYHKLIDRQKTDNSRRVEAAATQDR